MMRQGQKTRSMRFMRPEKKYDEKLLDLARVVRVTKGGKIMGWRAVAVIGDKKGKVGIGVGKVSAKKGDASIAIQKAKKDAEKKMIYFPMIKETIPHEVSAKYCAAKVILKPASKGHGLVAGGAIRTICDLVGIKDISAKILGGTSNKLSNAQATLLALKKLRSKKEEKKEGKEVKKEKKENKEMEEKKKEGIKEKKEVREIKKEKEEKY